MFFLEGFDCATASAPTAIEMPAGNRLGQTTDEYVAVGGGSGSFVIFAGAQNGGMSKGVTQMCTSTEPDSYLITYIIGVDL